MSSGPFSYKYVAISDCFYQPTFARTYIHQKRKVDRCYIWTERIITSNMKKIIKTVLTSRYQCSFIACFPVGISTTALIGTTIWWNYVCNCKVWMCGRSTSVFCRSKIYYLCSWGQHSFPLYTIRTSYRARNGEGLINCCIIMAVRNRNNR